MKKFIRIQSTKNVNVIPGITFVDMTNEDAHVADRLRVAATWSQEMIMIKEGTHYYPSIIQTWDTVKSLVESGVLTLGLETDDCDDADAIAAVDQLKNAIARYEAMSKQAAKDPQVTHKKKTTKPTETVGE